METDKKTMYESDIQKIMKKIRDYIVMNLTLVFCWFVLLVVGACFHVIALAVIGGVLAALSIFIFCILMRFYSRIVEIDAFDVVDFEGIICNLSKNDAVMSAIKAYAETSFLPLKVLEIASLPLKVSLKFNFFEILKDENDVYRISFAENIVEYGDCNYSKFAHQFNNSILLQNYELVKEAFNSRHDFIDGNQYFHDTKKAYLSLIESGELSEGNMHQYYAFLYLLYRAKKELCYEQAVYRLNRYGLKISDNEDTIIKTMINYEPENIVCTTLWSIIDKKKNFNASILIEYNRIETKVEQFKAFATHKYVNSKASTSQMTTEAATIDKYINRLKSNKELMCAIDDYVENNYESVREIEMAILPINQSGNKISMSIYMAEDSEYVEFLDNCNVNLLKQYSNSPFRIRKERMLFNKRDQLREVKANAKLYDYDLFDCSEFMLHYFKHGRLSYSYSELAEIRDNRKLYSNYGFYDLKDLYKSLYQKRIIESNEDASFYAFLFLVYIAYKKYYYQRMLVALNTQMVPPIDINDEDKNIIGELVDYDCFSSSDIVNVLWLKYEEKKNFLGSYCAFWCNNKFRIESIIEQVKNEFNEADEIDKYISELSLNNNLMTIVKNFVDNNCDKDEPIAPFEFGSNNCRYFQPSLLDFEIASLPLKEKKNDIGSRIYVANKNISSNSNYAQFVKNLPDNVNGEIMLWLKACKYKKLITCDKFEVLWELFAAMDRQDIFVSYVFDEECKDYQFRAFLYLIYRAKKEKIYECALERLSRYNIKLDADEDEIIEKLYYHSVDIELIEETIWVLAEKRNNFNNSILGQYLSVDKKTLNFIEDLREKQQIKKLLGTDLCKGSKNKTYDIDSMSGEQFEKLIAKLFSFLGYNTNITSFSSDQGVDIIAKNDIITIAIQAKCYNSGAVGNHAIMEVVGGMKFYGADKAMVVTNSTFTRSAIELAKTNGVILWGRDILIEKLEEMN